MRHRIDELEAELKAQKTAQASTEKPGLVTAAFPVKPAEAAAIDSVRSSSSQEAAMASDQKKPIIPAKQEPFSDADWTWLNGNPRTKEIFWDTKFFTPEIRADMNYVVDFNHPTDHSIGGSSELFRSSEVQLEQFGVGGDFHYDNVRARLMTQFGMYSATTPRNDPSPGHGQWDLVSAYRYVSEAYGGYHFDVMHGVNVDAGIFLSYIGLFSYYNFDNWAYQPSYVSSNTPWFFNGVRVQIFPDGPFEDRAMVYQWMAGVRIRQSQARARRTDQMDSDAMDQHHLEQLWAGPGRPFHTRTAGGSTPTTASR